jgi:diaminopimelate decarboxylase
MTGYASLGDLPYAHTLPRTASIAPSGRLAVGGCDLRDLVAEHGSPLYVFDEAHFRAIAREFREAFESRWQAGVVIAYAAKAFLSKAIARIADEEGLGMDVVSGGELGAALVAGFPAERIYFHGNNKLPDELGASLDAAIGHVVVDNFHELELLDRLAGERGQRQPILLRLSPNVDPHTHEKTTTGLLDSKFGFAIANGDAARAVAGALARGSLELRGLHVHLGSPIFELEPYAEGVRVVAEFAAAMRDEHGWEMAEFSPGGGFALAYTRDQHPPSIADYAETITARLRDELGQRNLPLPSLHVEPGRSLVGGSMIAVYTVGARKEIPGVRTYVSLDGGMADNVRPAMYGSRYEAIPVDRPLAAPEETVSL